MYGFASFLALYQSLLVSVDQILTGFIYSILKLLHIVGIHQVRDGFIALFDNELEILNIRAIDY